MSCKSCGREPENGTPTHWIGCPEQLRDHARNLVAPDFSEALCAQDGCTNPKRPPGKGPKPKYCTEHSDPKTRK